MTQPLSSMYVWNYICVLWSYKYLHILDSCLICNYKYLLVHSICNLKYFMVIASLKNNPKVSPTYFSKLVNGNKVGTNLCWEKNNEISIFSNFC